MRYNHTAHRLDRLLDDLEHSTFAERQSLLRACFRLLAERKARTLSPTATERAAAQDAIIRAVVMYCATSEHRAELTRLLSQNPYREPPD